MLRRLAVFTSLAALVSGAIACGRGHADEDAQESAGAVVDEPTFERAHGAIRAIDYLPFEFRYDGCYARAYYMAMELAAVRIEANSVFAFQGAAQPWVEWDGGSTVWDFHVAPVIEVSTASGTNPVVVDPSIASTPLSLDGWLSAMHVSSENVTLAILKGAVLQSSEARSLTQNGSWRSQLTHSFEDMPNFRVGDIESACGSIHRILLSDALGVDANGIPYREPVALDAALAIAAPKRQRLLARTSELVRALADVGKLEGAIDSFSEARCASN